MEKKVRLEGDLYERTLAESDRLWEEAHIDDSDVREIANEIREKLRKELLERKRLAEERMKDQMP